MGVFGVFTALVQGSDDDGLTWREVVADLPTDGPSIVVLLLLVVSVAWVVWASRSGGRGGRTRGGA